MIGLKKLGLACAIILVGSLTAVVTAKAGETTNTNLIQYENTKWNETTIQIYPTKEMVEEGVKTLRLTFEVEPNTVTNAKIQLSSMNDIKVLKAEIKEDKTQIELYVASTTPLFPKIGEKVTIGTLNLFGTSGNTEKFSLKPKSLDMVTAENTDFFKEHSDMIDVIQTALTISGGVSLETQTEEKEPQIPETSGNESSSGTSEYRMNIALLNIEMIPAQIYTGKNIEPDVAIKHGIVKLEKDKDYTVTYKNNKQVGTATVTIQGIGNYRSSVTKTFQITKASLSKMTYKKIPTQPYTKKAVKPDVVIKNGKIKLKLGTDYTVTYKNNVKAGKATVIVKGRGNYKGTKKLTFIISKKLKSIKTVKVLGVKNYSYTGKKIQPVLKIMDGKKRLKEGKDYTLSYSNNKNVGKASITIKGKGNYRDTKIVSFRIYKKT